MRILLFIFPLAAFADFPHPVDSETQPGAPMPAEEVAAKTKMPPGFEVTVFASEPEVMNPIDCSWDSRGRMWVAENFTYERLGSNLRDDLRDRVILLKDTTGDGRADERRVFTDTLINLTSIEWTPEGLWVMCPPRLMFIPDKNRDAVPDSEPQVVLDGFTVPPNNHHNFANGLRVGPDGWLYGRCGGSAPGEIGKPGTPDAERIPLRGAIWRYHRARGSFEVIASGTTNPWGHDWDEEGNLFLINTVNEHVYHAVPGMRLSRLMTHPLHPRVYETIPGIADHWHFDRGGKWHESRDGAANDFGGGHAHVGMMIYQGSNWPEEYRGRLFTTNLHGRRINQEILEPSGSGFVAKHAEDLFLTPDPFFRGIELTQGPHGEVYLLDWSDTGECHEHTGVHRNSGRIYMIHYGEYRTFTGDVSEQIPESLRVEFLVEPNAWMDRVAWRDRELLHWHEELHPADTDLAGVRETTDPWPLDTLRATRTDTPASTVEAEQSLPGLIQIADHSSRHRLQLASTLQRLPFHLRKDLAKALVVHAEDADDPNLPLLVWYGLIPLAEHHPDHLVEIFQVCEWPRLRRFIARALAENLDSAPESLNALMEASASADILHGMQEALAGWLTAEAPSAWPGFKARLPGSLAGSVQELDALFGTGRSLEEIEAIARDSQAPMSSRQSAVRSLIRARPEDLKAILLSLLDTRPLNSTAAEGLVHFDDPRVARVLLAKLHQFHSTEQDKVLGLLCSRPAFAAVLLDRIAEEKLPARRLSAFHARQIDRLGDPALSARLRELWGSTGLGDEAKARLIAETRAKLTPDFLAGADLDSGRALYQSRCAACHKLHGKGGELGPDLTGGGRGDLDYLLHNILDPAAELSPDFRMEILTLSDGRILTGVVKTQSPKTLVLQTMAGRETLDRSLIRSRETTEASLMPDGLLTGLGDDQVRDLIAYLMGKPARIPDSPGD